MICLYDVTINKPPYMGALWYRSELEVQTMWGQTGGAQDGRGRAGLGPGPGAHIMIYLCDFHELLIIYELFIDDLFNMY